MHGRARREGCCDAAARFCRCTCHAAAHAAAVRAADGGTPPPASPSCRESSSVPPPNSWSAAANASCASHMAATPSLQQRSGRPARLVAARCALVLRAAGGRPHGCMVAWCCWFCAHPRRCAGGWHGQPQLASMGQQLGASPVLLGARQQALAAVLQSLGGGVQVGGLPGAVGRGGCGRAAGSHGGRARAR